MHFIHFWAAMCANIWAAIWISDEKLLATDSQTSAVTFTSRLSDPIFENCYQRIERR
jgi:hypothetical protein